MEEQHQREADVFFRMVKDHGRFHESQLYRFVEIKTGGGLDEHARHDLLDYARKLGAKREKGVPEVYLLPTKMRRMRRWNRHNDQQLDMFDATSPAPSTAKRRRTA
jgi:hypothetical protein